MLAERQDDAVQSDQLVLDAVSARHPASSAAAAAASPSTSPPAAAAGRRGPVAARAPGPVHDVAPLLAVRDRGDGGRHVQQRVSAAATAAAVVVVSAGVRGAAVVRAVGQQRAATTTAVAPLARGAARPHLVLGRPEPRRRTPVNGRPTSDAIAYRDEIASEAGRRDR